jgi:sulfatase modifying factor 1
VSGPRVRSAGHATLVRGCRPEMVRVQDYCIDRWEVALVDRTSGARLSPYYPPHPNLLRRVRDVWLIERENFGDDAARAMPLPDLPAVQSRGKFAPLAVSRPGVVPQGYLTYGLASQACANAGKRLCTEEEWIYACRGLRQTRFPYGSQYVRGKCNVHRMLHPAHILHGNSSIGHSDPRLNLVVERGVDPLLHLTGATPSCVSKWSDDDLLYDMVGNLDEWIDDESGRFVGGFYSRMTTMGCESRITSHSPSYYDYSLGTRCCADAQANPPSQEARNGDRGSRSLT